MPGQLISNSSHSLPQSRGSHPTSSVEDDEVVSALHSTEAGKNRRSPVEVDLFSSVLLFVGFCAVVFLWAKGGVTWWEHSVEPYLPSGLLPLSDVVQLGIGGLAFMSALATVCNLSDLWCKVIKRRE